MDETSADPSQRARESRGSRSPRHPRRTDRPSAHLRRLDIATEALLYFTIIFAPWAFGATEPWAIRTLNTAGLFLAGLAIAATRTRSNLLDPPQTGPKSRGVRILLTLNLLFLAYVAIGALNARGIYVDVAGVPHYQYRDCLRWLPHSYDRTGSWDSFWQYAGLSGMFWAARGWLLNAPRQRGRGALDAREGPDFPPLGVPACPPDRLRRLLWVLSINTALLATVCILQRLHGTNRLLWLVLPHINQEPATQFGPFAYRANAAQLFNLAWPMMLVLWWLLRGSPMGNSGGRVGGESRLLLLPAIALTAASPIISTSRGGALVALLGMVGVGVAGWFALRRAGGGTRWALVLPAVAAILLGGYLGWGALQPRLKHTFNAGLTSRLEIHDNAAKIAQEFPLWGAGAGSFPLIYQTYRTNLNQLAQAYAHDDWLQTRVELGWAGFVVLIAALTLVLVSPGFAGGILVPIPIVLLMQVPIALTLLHALFDFPLQVHAVLSLFLLQCAIISSVSCRR